MSLFDQIEGLREAVDLEQRTRSESFIDIADRVGPFWIAAITPRRWAMLEQVRSPAVFGGIWTPVHLARFLWILHPAFPVWTRRLQGALPVRIAARIRQRFFFARIGRQNFEALLIGINDFIDRTFIDAPIGSRFNGEVPYFHSTAGTVDRLAHDYGWTDEHILDVPFARLFQYQKAMLRRKNPKSSLWNRSDQVKDAFLAKRNAEKRKAENGKGSHRIDSRS